MTPLRTASFAALCAAILTGVTAPTWFSPARAGDENMWCGAAWSCEMATPGASIAPRVIDKYAALAIAEKTRFAGSSDGQNSQVEAEQLALSNCARNGNNKDCKILSWTRNMCMGIAVSYPDGAYGWASSASRAGAGNGALSRCNNTGGKNCVVWSTPCASDDPRWPPPLPLPPGASNVGVDPNTTGTWEVPRNPGRWIWEIGAHGTYEFHSEAPDGAPPQAGSFSANGGTWSMKATNGYSDGGTYQFQPPDILVATGKLGTASWHRVATGN